MLSDLDTVVGAVCQHSASVPGDIDRVVADAVDRLAPLATEHERRRIIARAIARLDGLDVLEEFLGDPEVDEVMVNAGREIWVERCGVVERVDELPDGAIDVVLERVLAPLGQRLDRSTPMVDARLADGARLCAVVAPIAVDGTTVSIRRHRRRRIPLDRFTSRDVIELLDDVVRRRLNVLVTGGTSTGKTTLLAALVDRIPEAERLVIIEDTAELSLRAPHVVRLEARTGTVDGVAPVDTIQLVRAALRLRPDRLIIGEFRGPEVVATVQALNTGHDGSLSTCHANNAVDGLRRVETLVLQAAPAWPLEAIRRNVTRSIDVVVHLDRMRGGQRRITEVVEVTESSAEPTGRVLAEADRVLAAPERNRT